MNIPKENIPKFLVAIVVLIIIIFALTRNGEEKFVPEFNFDPELSEEGEMLIQEENAMETVGTTPAVTKTSETITTAPATAESVSSCYPSLSAKKESKYNGILLNWTACTNDDFQFYKVVKSSKNSNPSYPSDPVLLSSANRNYTNTIDKTVARATTYYYRVCAVNRLNKVTCGNTASATY